MNITDVCRIKETINEDNDINDTDRYSCIDNALFMPVDSIVMDILSDEGNTFISKAATSDHRLRYPTVCSTTTQATSFDFVA
jgi:hypothetical protein